MIKSMSEVLKEVSERRKIADRVQLLQQNDSDVLRGVLFVAFAKEAIGETLFDLPEGAPAYNESQLVDNQAKLIQEWSKMNQFLKPKFGGVGLPVLRRETLFLQLLEALTPDDARLLLSIKDGVMPYTGVSRKVVDTAFPGLIPNG